MREKTQPNTGAVQYNFLYYGFEIHISASPGHAVSVRKYLERTIQNVLCKRCHLGAEIIAIEALASCPHLPGLARRLRRLAAGAAGPTREGAVPRNNGGGGKGAHTAPDPLGWVSSLEDHRRDIHATRSRGAGAEVFIPPETIDKGIDSRTTRPENFRAGNNPC